MITAPAIHDQPARHWLQPQRPWLWVAGLTVLAACLRSIGLNRGLWWDEIYFLIISVRHPLAEIITSFPADTQHPLYSILTKLAVDVFGEHPWTLRLPAVIFGVGSIPMLFVLGASVTRQVEALFAAALLAVSYHHVWFSQNARGYTALAFWTLLSTYLLFRGLQTGRRAPYLAYGVAAGLGAFTHVTMLFVVASHIVICAAVVLARSRRGFGWNGWKFPVQGFLIAGALTLLLYAPILTQVENFFVHRPSAMRAVSTPGWALWETLRGLRLGFGTSTVLAGAAVLIVVGAWSYFKQNRLIFALFGLPGVFMALGAVAVRGTMYPRFYFLLIGFAVLILVRGVVVFAEWMGAHTHVPVLAPVLSVTMAAGLLVSSAISLVRNYRYPKQDFEGAIHFIDTHTRQGETIVTAGATTYPVRRYYGRSWKAVETERDLEQICRQAKTVWLVYTFPRYLEAAVPGVTSLIEKDFKIIRVFPGTLGDGDVFVARFSNAETHHPDPLF